MYSLVCAVILDVPIFRGNKVFFNDVARRIGKFVVDEVRYCTAPVVHMKLH